MKVKHNQNLNGENMQKQYDLIYRYFKTTTESYDTLEWDGKNLEVILKDSVIENYTH